MAFTYPILLDLTNLPILIVGGGEVALRKAQGLLAAGAGDIRAVATSFHPAFPTDVRRIVAPYSPSQLAGARLVFAATDDPQVNEQVVRDARTTGVIANRADHAPDCHGDFSLPAVHRNSSLIIAVSTGHSPALAAAVRDQIASSLDPAYGRLATFSDEIRRRVHALPELDETERRRLLRLLASEEAVEIAREGDGEVLWNWLLQKHSMPDPGVE